MASRMFRAGLIIVVIALAGYASPSQAAPGIYLGGAFGGVAPSFGGSHLDGIDWESGSNWEFFGGMNFTRNVGFNMHVGQMLGDADSEGAGPMTYTQTYFDAGLHLVYDAGDPGQNQTSIFQPYLDLGMGFYTLSLDAPDYGITEDFLDAVGFRAAVGMNIFPIDKVNIFIAPEVAWHWVEYSESTWDEPSGIYSLTGLDANGNSMTFQLKVGYHFFVGG